MRMKKLTNRIRGGWKPAGDGRAMKRRRATEEGEGGMTDYGGMIALVDYASRAFNISRGALVGPNRAIRCARPRQVIMWYAARHYGFSTPTIGKGIGRRDHTTVMHGIRKIEVLRERRDEFVLKLDQAFAAAMPPVMLIRSPVKIASQYLPHEYVSVVFAPDLSTPYVVRSDPVPPPVIRRPPKVLATPIAGPVVIEHDRGRMMGRRA